MSRPAVAARGGRLRAGLPAIALAAAILACPAVAQTLVPDLKGVPAGRGWKGAIAAARLVDRDGAAAIEFAGPARADGQEVVWLDGFVFDEGSIEFDARGKGAPPQSSFVGVAFRTVDGKTHDAVYFRPFNFAAADAERRSHAVQYISEPLWPWERLRRERTGQFEQPVTPAPDGDAWFHARLDIAQGRVRVFVNGAPAPVLEAGELSGRSGGSVGLWCNGYCAIANLRITQRN